MIAATEMMASAAPDLTGVGSMISEAHAAAALPTTALMAARAARPAHPAATPVKPARAASLAKTANPVNPEVLGDWTTTSVGARYGPRDYGLSKFRVPKLPRITQFRSGF